MRHKPSLILLAVLTYGSMSPTTEAATLYLGDGVTKPIDTTGTKTWDSTTSNWLSPNTALGNYGTWTNGEDAVLLGTLPIITVGNSSNIVVNNVTREDGASGDDTANRMDLGVAAGSTLTINGNIDGADGGTRQFNLNGGGGTVGGDFTLSDINRFVLTSNVAFAASTVITHSQANGSFRFDHNLTVLAHPNLTLQIGGATNQQLDYRITGTTLGALNGNGSITSTLPLAGTASSTINALGIGSSSDGTGVGSLSATTYVGDIVLGSGSHPFDIDFTGGLGGETADLLSLDGSTGDLTLGGTLDVSLFAGGPLVAGATFDLFDAASISGAFSSVMLPELAPGLAWDTSSLATTGEISVVPTVPEPSSLVLCVLAIFGVALCRRPRK